MKRLIFFGTSDFAVPALRKLVQEKYDVVVITAPDALVGRRQVLKPSPISLLAEELGLPVLKPKTLKDDKFFEEYKSLRVEVGVVAAYGKIIPQRYLDVTPKGLLNIHPSLLPKYRGPSPIQSVIAEGQKETGVSIMLVDAEVDHGPILKSGNYTLPSDAYFPEISQELAERGADLLIEVLPKYLGGKLRPKEQDHSQATFTKKMASEDGHIDWNQSAESIQNKIRAYNPEPGAWTMWDGNILKILKGRAITHEKHDSTPGTVLKTGGEIAIQTGDGFLILDELQLQGKKPVSALAFLNGHQRFLAGRLS